MYTGRLERRLYGQAKADALAELARDEALDLAASTAYSDSHSDVPFLEAVGHPIAVNPDRELRRIARASEVGRRCASGRWRFPGDDVERSPEPPGGARARAAGGRRARRALRGRGTAREGRARSLAGRLARVARVRSCRSSARSLESEEGFERWDGHGALGYLVLEEIVRATLADPPERARVVVVAALLSDGRPRLLGAAARRGWSRRRAHRNVASSPGASGRRRAAHRDEPSRDRDPVERRRTDRHGCLDGCRDARRRPRRALPDPKSSCRSGVSRRTRRSLSLSGSSFSFPLSRDRSMAPSSWSLAQTTTRCLRSASSRQVAGCPATVSSSAG